MNTNPSTSVSLPNENIERLLYKILPYFFAFLFVTTVVGALTGYLKHDPWTIGDWLINYQGGMVRRGLLGEFIYMLSSFTPINPGFYVIFFQSLFYAAFFFFSYSLLKKQYALLPYALLIFSPFIFTFQINDPDGGYRKEIIYFAVLAFVTWSAKTKEHRSFEKIFYITLLLYPVVILTHEILAVFLPYLLVVYISMTSLTKRKLIIIFLILLLSIVSFAISIYYSGTANQANAIFNSLTRENYTVISGAISNLHETASDEFRKMIIKIKNDHYIYYLLVVGFSLIAYLPLRRNLNYFIKNKLSLLMILISIIGSIPLFFFARDWGRFIYIHLVSLCLLSLLSTKLTNTPLSNNRILNKYMITAFFLIYTLCWHIPHSGSPIRYAQNIKQINAVAFVKPYLKIAGRFSK